MGEIRLKASCQGIKVDLDRQERAGASPQPGSG
jgi:hypothetical protein